ncbi:hypothetical protein [Peribacillus sp. Hz7]|uniref:hypothetical protein n=1 Tax=Peribacillus sp. Hz7 TaxID=3344873 RepID=UPI0035C9964E
MFELLKLNNFIFILHILRSLEEDPVHTCMEASSKAARANLFHRHPQLKLQVGSPELAAPLTRRSQSWKLIHPAAMLPPIQEASPAYLHGSNSKEENNLSSNKEKLFSSFLV